MENVKVAKKYEKSSNGMARQTTKQVRVEVRRRGRCCSAQAKRYDQSEQPRSHVTEKYGDACEPEKPIKVRVDHQGSCWGEIKIRGGPPVMGGGEVKVREKKPKRRGDEMPSCLYEAYEPRA